MIRLRSFVSTIAALAALTAPVRAADAPGAKPAAPAIKPFETVQLTPTAWYGRFGVTNCAWLDLGEGVLLVDAGASADDAANLKKEIQRTANKPVKWILLTHLHKDSNGGLPALFPTNATVFVNQRVTPSTAAGLERLSAGGKHATVVGVSERLFLYFGPHPFEILVPKGPAHSDSDLVGFAPELGMAFVGDLVTPGRCPIMTDPVADPKLWEETLDGVLAIKPAVLIPSRGEAAVRPEVTTKGRNLDKEVQATHVYIQRLVKILTEKRKAKAPAASLASELRLATTGEYCPVELDAANAQALYARLTAEGTFPPARPAPPKPAGK